MYFIPALAAFLGIVLCGYAAKGVVLHCKGTPCLAANGKPMPFSVWPFLLFTGLMVLAGGLPALFGEPMWLLNKVFALIAAL